MKLFRFSYTRIASPFPELVGQQYTIICDRQATLEILLEHWSQGAHKYQSTTSKPSPVDHRDVRGNPHWCVATAYVIMAQVLLKKTIYILP